MVALQAQQIGTGLFRGAEHHAYNGGRRLCVQPDQLNIRLHDVQGRRPVRVQVLGQQ